MHPSLSFNPANGSIQISSVACPISHGMSKDLVVSVLENFFRTGVNHGNGYEWLMFHQLSFSSKPCGLSLCFHHDILKQVSFGVSMLDRSVDEGGWPTRETIDAEIFFIRQVLAELFSRSFSTGHEQFPWGTVWSDFDIKGFQASSGIRYAQYL